MVVLTRATYAQKWAPGGPPEGGQSAVLVGSTIWMATIGSCGVPALPTAIWTACWQRSAPRAPQSMIGSASGVGEFEVHATTSKPIANSRTERGRGKDQVSHRSRIWPASPGTGNESASASTAVFSFSAKRAPRGNADVRAVPVPGPSDLAVDEERSRPDSRGPEGRPMLGVGYEQLAFATPGEEVRVAAWQKPCGGNVARRFYERRLIVGENPAVTDRGPSAHELRFEGFERLARSRGLDPRPLGKPVGRARSEHAEVASSELDAGLERIHLGLRDRPDDRRPSAFPADEDPAGRRAVSKRVRIDADRAAGRAV
jgi:hypothetical protein